MKCPICGALHSLYYSEMYQVAKEQRILRNGRLSKTVKTTGLMSEEWSMVACSQCHTIWSALSTKQTFEFDPEGKLILGEPSDS